MNRGADHRIFEPPWQVEAGGPPLSVAELLAVLAARATLWLWWATAAAVLAFLQPGRASFTRLGGLPRRRWVRLPKLLTTPKPDPPVVLAVGDSITEGVVSADWVAALAAGLRGRAQVVNAGVSGATAPEIAGRVAGLIDAYGPRRVAVVLIMAGTNDMLATTRGEKSQRRYRASAGLPRTVFGRTSALAGVAAALDAVALAAPNAKVGVLTLPPIGEAVDSQINAAVRDTNRALRAAAAARPGVALLDAHAAVSAAIAVAGAAAEKNRARGGVVRSLLARLRPPPPAGLRPWTTLTALAARVALRLKWDTVGRAIGGRILYDGVHLGETGAACVLALVVPFCRRALRDARGWAYDR